MILLAVDHLDGAGNRTSRHEIVRYGQFIKHFAVAGQGYTPSVSRLLRAIGSALWFQEYLSPRSYAAGRFGRPPATRGDPTAQAQFSNLAGRAFADLLAKRIDGAEVTFGYEAAMSASSIPIKGPRPDLYCVGGGRQFAVEAKGFSVASMSDRAMSKHKAQASSGPLRVHFSVASVSYDLFSAPKCCYHDPVDVNTEFDGDLTASLSRRYYRGWLEILDSGLFRIRRTEIDGRSFYRLSIRPNTVELDVPWFPISRRLLPSLLIDTRAEQFAETGGWPESPVRSDSRILFVDSDGIGIYLGSNDGEI